MKAKWDSVLTVTLVACAVTTTALVIHREFGAPAMASSQASTQRREYIRDWRAQLGHGVRLGSTSAPIQLIEFADFECPYCGDFHKQLKGLREQYPAQVSITYVHFPLQGHRFALPAARASECAGEQGRFEAMYDQLFEGQDSFGLKPWNDYAIAAGVPDLAAFDACTKRTEAVPRIEEGKQLGAKLDVKGTPTLIVNGWMLGRPPSREELDAMVKAVLAGKSPVTALAQKS
jgi:protein-disulfide isomerase